ncbi:MAG: magnesium transporter [Anaerolineales bacterium]
MTFPETQTILAQVQQALEKDDLNKAIQVLQSLRTEDQAEVFEDLDDEDQASLLPGFSNEISADILEYIEDEDAARLVSSMSPDQAIPIVNEMEPDEIADLLGDIHPEQAQEILSKLEHPEEVTPLLLHPDESAGGLMTSEYLALRREMLVRDGFNAVRNWGKDKRTLYYLYIVDEHDKLVGVTDLQKLIGENPVSHLGDIMESDIVTVNADTDQEECSDLMSRYNLIALPVVTDTGRLLGVITVDDVLDVLVEEATEDIQKMGGAEPLGEPYLLTKIPSVFRKRIFWLLLLFLTASLTGYVMRLFENELQAVVALTFFIPLLIGTGGNAGSQTTNTIIRSLAVGDMEVRDAIKALWHESRVGLMLGGTLALAAFIRAITWDPSIGLAFTVAIAIMTIVIWANLLGAVLPILAMRLKIDPTVVSGPVMSTLVDATGLFIYFSIAKIMLGI